MIEQFKKWILAANVEDRIFLIALSFATPYFLVQIVFDLWNKSPLEYIILDFGLLFVSMLFYFLSKNNRMRPKLMNAFGLILLASFIYYWQTSGGILGGAPYTFPVLSVLVISISKGIYRKIVTVVLVVLTLTLTTDFLQVSGEPYYANLLFDFFINLIILALLLIIFKLALDQERSGLEAQNIRINELNDQLAIKSTELQEYNSEIELIQQNLKNLVDKRTEKLHQENEKDLEYSFINAHLVRAPIANIIAITQHLNDPKLEELEKSIHALDSTVRKIGKILSVPELE